ncbi:hypothetical protein YSY22_00450 [Brevibacillus formosus]
MADYYTSGPFLHLSEESFHLLLQSNDVVAAKDYWKDFQESTEQNGKVHSKITAVNLRLYVQVLGGRYFI